MSDPRFFGYGSLVNLGTHDYHAPRPARLSGWRRVWRHSSRRPVAFLSVTRCEATAIDGIIAEVRGADWAALDAREAAYIRRDVTHQVEHDGTPMPTALYEAAHGHIAPPSANHPILLSYLDVVVQGFLTQFGEGGVARFFETTDGWGPVLNDRAAPRYPRHRDLSTSERDLVDHHLAALPPGIADPAREPEG